MENIGDSGGTFLLKQKLKTHSDNHSLTQYKALKIKKARRGYEFSISKQIQIRPLQLLTLLVSQCQE